ncbi:MAG: hypothetical protein GX251_02470 [Firmicutes bacterium]|nr:hypothetical protein [Bacillota bacterium]
MAQNDKVFRRLSVGLAVVVVGSFFISGYLLDYFRNAPESAAADSSYDVELHANFDSLQQDYAKLSNLYEELLVYVTQAPVETEPELIYVEPVVDEKLQESIDSLQQDYAKLSSLYEELLVYVTQAPVETEPELIYVEPVVDEKLQESINSLQQDYAKLSSLYEELLLREEPVTEVPQPENLVVEERVQIVEYVTVEAVSLRLMQGDSIWTLLYRLGKDPDSAELIGEVLKINDLADPAKIPTGKYLTIPLNDTVSRREVRN